MSHQHRLVRADNNASSAEGTAKIWISVWVAVSGLVFGLVLCGCTANHYRRSADKEVYRIVQQAERDVFGHTNRFTIETGYSHRKPEEITPAELIEDRLRTNQRLLTIDMALNLAVTSSRRFQTAKEALYIAALGLTGVRYQFSPHFLAQSVGTLEPDAGGGRVGRLRTDVGMRQLLRSGGRLGINLANDILLFYSGDSGRSIMTTLSVDLVQPLLRGFGRDSAVIEALTQAERDVIYDVRSFGLFQDGFAVEIVNDYFSLLAQKDTIRNLYTNYLSRVQSTERLEARAEDREQLSDVDQARQAELTARNNYVNAAAEYRNALDQFKIKLGLPVNERVQLDDSALVAVETNGLVAVPLNPIEGYRLAVQRQLAILNAIDRFEDSKRKVRVAINQLRPDLDLFGNVTVQNDPPTDYSRFNPEVEARGGVQINLPLDRLLERNNYRRELIDFEAAVRNLTLVLDGLKDDIERGLRTLDQRRQSYEIQKNALELANRRVASSTLLLQAGRAEVRDLVEAQDAQIAAQTAVTEALVEYQEARLELMVNLGALDTELPSFWLQDHLTHFVSAPGPAAGPVLPGQQPVLLPEAYFDF